jgi:hypothetical protein
METVMKTKAPLITCLECNLNLFISLLEIALKNQLLIFKLREARE